MNNGKVQRTAIQTKNLHTKIPLELVHSDEIGPIEMKSI